MQQLCQSSQQIAQIATSAAVGEVVLVDPLRVWPVLLASPPPSLSARSLSSRGEGRGQQNRVRVPLKLGGGRQANRDRRGNRYPLWLRPLLLVRTPTFSSAKSFFCVFCGLQAFEERWQIVGALFCNI